LDDAVARADVMEQKVAVGMDDLRSERIRHQELTTVDRCSRRSRTQRSHMTDVAIDLIGIARTSITLFGRSKKPRRKSKGRKKA